MLRDDVNLLVNKVHMSKRKPSNWLLVKDCHYVVLVVNLHHLFDILMLHSLLVKDYVILVVSETVESDVASPVSEILKCQEHH